MKALSKRDIYKRIFKQLAPYKAHVAATIMLALVTVAGNLWVPIIFGDVIDLVISPGNVDFSAMTEKFWLLGGVIGATCAAQWLMNVINNKITYEVVRDIRAAAFEHIQVLPLNYIDSHSYGDVVSRNIADVDQFADGLLMGFTQLFTGVLTIIGTLVLMLAINWIIALIVFFITPLSLFVARFIAKRTYSLFIDASRLRGEQTAFVEEMIDNLKVVQAFNREELNGQKFDEINQRLTKTSLKSIFYSSLTNPCTRFVNSIVYAAVALSGALTLIFPSVLPVAFSVGRLTTLLSYSNQYTKPFNEISGVVTELQNAVACAGRIFELIDEPAQQPDAKDALELESAKGDVAFESVTFSYDPQKPLIRDLNIRAKAGQRVAIVGPTGCGKTTLINLLMRFYDPQSGSISVDGRDTRSVTRRSLRKNYGMVLQDTWLKHGFIMQMENGYDTVIGEDGGSLSQGQKQLLCITRIMLCLPPMLILDEATSSIDTRTEMRIQNAFARLMEGRTSFIVAHRLSTIKEADIILVMKDGNIIEQGTHVQLLEKRGFYFNLYNSQFAR